MLIGDAVSLCGPLWVKLSVRGPQNGVKAFSSSLIQSFVEDFEVAHFCTHGSEMARLEILTLTIPVVGSIQEQASVEGMYVLLCPW